MTLSNDLLLSQVLHAGASAFQRGDWNAALDCGRSAVTLAPEHAGARSLFGLALLQLGQVGPAIAELERAAGRDKNNAGLLGNLAQAYAMAGRHADAHHSYRRAQRLAPAHWPYAQGAAIALAEQGKPEAAEPLLRRLTEHHSQQAAPWYNLGNVQLQLGKPAEAEQSFQAALRRAPDDPDIRLSLGTALHRQSRFSAAAAAYRDCIAAQPDWIPPRLNLVSALIDDGKFREAEQECEPLINRAPELAEAHRFLGAARGHQGKQLQALGAYRRAAECAPDDALSQRSYGGALAECGQLHAALRVLAQAETLEPGGLGMQQLRSTVELAHGMFSDGWSAYRSRPACLMSMKTWPDAGIIQNLPDNLAGKHVIVHREQGLGDELFFLRQLPLLKSRGARITVHASAKIAELIRRANIADAVVPDTVAPPINADIQILCGDLPHALQPSHAVSRPWRDTPCAMRDYPIHISAYFPHPAPSLRIPALPEALARMRERLRQIGAPPYVGITWRAGTVASAQRSADWVLSKEIPLALLGAALQQGRGTLIALQRHPAAGEIAALAAASARPVADLSALNEQLEDIRALLELLDDYIGVSNTNMHLRAAAGRAARVLVPSPAEWRWMNRGERSPWFPQFRVYRQSLQGDWTPALHALMRDLAQPA
jgi:tetratricopeptide (TPR) repeat protein